MNQEYDQLRVDIPSDRSLNIILPYSAHKTHLVINMQIIPTLSPGSLLMTVLDVVQHLEQCAHGVLLARIQQRSLVCLASTLVYAVTGLEPLL